MEKYVFRFNQVLETGYLENEITGIEVEIFYSQLEGLELIEEMLEKNIIDLYNAIALIHNIVNSEMLLWFDSEKKIDVLTYNFMMASYMLEIREKIQLKLFDNKKSKDKIRLHVCEHCGNHGFIICNDVISEEIVSKDQAIEVLEKISSKIKITYLEKEKLIEEIEESSLPNIDPGIISRLN